MINCDEGIQYGEEGMVGMKKGIEAWHLLLRLYTDTTLFFVDKINEYKNKLNQINKSIKQVKISK